jgi:tetratricopeptide (TPR) repeat protein
LASDLQLRLAEQLARLDSTSPERRRAIYDEARTALNAEIRAGAPFVAVQEAVRRRRELETAIIAMEREAARNDPPPALKKFEREVVPEPVKEAVPVVSADPATAETSAFELPSTAAHPRESESPESQSNSQAALDSRLRGNERDSDADPSEQVPIPAPPEGVPDASSNAIIEQIDLDFGEPEHVPRHSALRSFTLYAAVVVLVLGIVVAAAMIAGLGVDEVRVTDSTPSQTRSPELRLRTGPSGVAPSNPAAALFRSAGFNTAAAGALKEGTALLERGDVDRAIVAFDDAIRLDPREPAGYGNRAFAYWRKGAVDRAIADYSEAITLDPNNPANHLNRAIAYNRIGEYERAVADLDRVIVASPANTEALNSRCWARAILKHLEEALADCSEALRLKPDDANILDSRGFVYLRLGRLDRAIADYGAALKIDPKLAASLYGRGLARIGRGDRAGGAEDVAAARAIDPGIQDTFARYGIR